MTDKPEAPEEPAAPFSAAQIEWLDARYRKSLPYLEQELAAQGAEPPGADNAEPDDGA